MEVGGQGGDEGGEVWGVGVCDGVLAGGFEKLACEEVDEGGFGVSG